MVTAPGVVVEGAAHVADPEPRRAFAQLAARFFAPSEQAVLNSLPPERRAAAFHECWTRKEALLKATGAGIGGALAELAVSFGDGAPPRIVRAGGGIGDAGQWSLRALPAPAGYVSALAVHDSGPLQLLFLQDAVAD